MILGNVVQEIVPFGSTMHGTPAAVDENEPKKSPKP
jgi:lipoate synthase